MELRPGYKLTEVGVIPEEWEVKRLGDVVVVGRLGGNYPNQNQETIYPLMKMGNIGRGHFDVSKVEYIAPNVTPSSQHRLQRGDVLFNTRNTLDLVGKVAIWREELPIAYYNSNLMRLEFDARHVIANEYANATLNTARTIAFLRSLANGTTSVAAIYTRQLMQLPFVTPPLPEQQAIAEILGDVDALLDGLERLIAKKCDLKLAAMQELLTGRTRLPGFVGAWLDRRLEEVLRVRHGRSQEAVVVFDGKYPILATSGEIGRSNQFLYNKSSVLIGRKGTIDSPQYLDEPFWTIDTLFYTEIADTASPKFIFYKFKMINWLSYNEASGVPSLSAASIEAIEIKLPPLPEQQAIADILSDMDAELEALEARREKTRALKQAMMAELLTGRTRVVPG
ncbi:MAG: restriction endonuclease subunit S [Bacteroidetes bacterium]|nr:restriction endonuclease subunit S [Bacteroidota bacterium]